jgi:hypothetical protein
MWAAKSREKAHSMHGLGALAASGWVVLAVASHYLERPIFVYLYVMAGEWLFFLAAWRLSARIESGRLLAPIAVWSVVFLAFGFVARPVMEDDYFRYLWDGRQLATAGNPYAAPPATSFERADVPERFQQILDQINYPHVPTIYAPVCQFAFALSYGIAPGQLWPWKLMLVLVELALLGTVVVIARRVTNPPGGAETPEARRVIQAALVVGWCPLAVFETGFNAHPDVLGIALLSAAWRCRLRDRELACGLCCGLAAASKIFALPIVPFLLWRSRKGWMGFAAALACAYAPFWLQGSAADFAGLVALASEWEFNSSIYALARVTLGASAAKVGCAALFAAAWLWLWRRNTKRGVSGLNQSISPPGLEVFGAFFLVSATVNSWYLLWLVPFVAVRPALTAFGAMALVSLSYATGLNLGDAGLDNFQHPAWVRWVEYGGVALLGAAEWWRRRSKKAGQAGEAALSR